MKLKLELRARVYKVNINGLVLSKLLRKSLFAPSNSNKAVICRPTKLKRFQFGFFKRNVNMQTSSVDSQPANAALYCHHVATPGNPLTELKLRFIVSLRFSVNVPPNREFLFQSTHKWESCMCTFLLEPTPRKCVSRMDELLSGATNSQNSCYHLFISKTFLITICIFDNAFAPDLICHSEKSMLI